MLGLQAILVSVGYNCRDTVLLKMDNTKSKISWSFCQHNSDSVTNQYFFNKVTQIESFSIKTGGYFKEAWLINYQTQNIHILTVGGKHSSRRQIVTESISNEY